LGQIYPILLGKKVMKLGGEVFFKLISIFYENNPKNEIVALMKEKTVLSFKNEFL
jgi:hypothetical protein